MLLDFFLFYLIFYLYLHIFLRSVVYVVGALSCLLKVGNILTICAVKQSIKNSDHSLYFQTFFANIAHNYSFHILCHSIFQEKTAIFPHNLHHRRNCQVGHSPICYNCTVSIKWNVYTIKYKLDCTHPRYPPCNFPCTLQTLFFSVIHVIHVKAAMCGMFKIDLCTKTIGLYRVQPKFDFDRVDKHANAKVARARS